MIIFGTLLNAQPRRPHDLPGPMLHSQYIPIATKAHPKHWRLSGQLNTYNGSSRLRHLAIGAGLLILAAFLYSSHFTKHFAAPLDLDQPPTYEKLWKWERDLPQHDLDLPFPEGRTGRYVLFKNQVQMLGWNNHMNEMYAFFSPIPPPHCVLMVRKAL